MCEYKKNYIHPTLTHIPVSTKEMKLVISKLIFLFFSNTVSGPPDPDLCAQCTVSQSLSHMFKAEKAFSQMGSPKTMQGTFPESALPDVGRGTGYMLPAKGYGTYSRNWKGFEASQNQSHLPGALEGSWYGTY